MAQRHKVTILEGKITECDWLKIIAKYLKEAGGNKNTQKKWTTLVHNGPLFPKEYEPLPSGIKILYDGKAINLDKTNTNNELNLTAEECMIFLVNLVCRFKVKQPKQMPKYAKKNFMDDWVKVLGKGHIVKNLDKVDLSPIHRYFDNKKELEKKDKDDKTKEQKRDERKAKFDEKLANEKVYGYALYDDYKASISANIEAPMTFFSSAEQKHYKKDPSKTKGFKTGKIKKRLSPADVIINGSSIPECKYKGKECKWGKVVYKNTVDWFASWRDPVTGSVKYTVIKRSQSGFVCSRDKIKFETARNLCKRINKLRERYMKDLKSQEKTTRLKSLATYLLDTISIRAGGNKKEDQEEGGIGLVDLKCGNVKLKSANRVVFDFTGKSGVGYTKEIPLNAKMYSELKTLCADSKKSDTKIFGDISINELNKYLGAIINHLTAKTFRTWKACTVFSQELNKSVATLNISDDTHKKVYCFNMANVAVGKALNHKSEITKEQSSKLDKKRVDLEQRLEDTETPSAKVRAQTALEKHLNVMEQKQSKIATGTSKGNYIDPRITVAWAKRTQTPIEALYTSGIRNKFKWAMSTKSTWKF